MFLPPREGVENQMGHTLLPLQHVAPAKEFYFERVARKCACPSARLTCGGGVMICLLGAAPTLERVLRNVSAWCCLDDRRRTLGEDGKSRAHFTPLFPKWTTFPPDISVYSLVISPNCQVLLWLVSPWRRQQLVLGFEQTWVWQIFSLRRTFTHKLGLLFSDRARSSARWGRGMMSARAGHDESRCVWMKMRLFHPNAPDALWCCGYLRMPPAGITWGAAVRTNLKKPAFWGL